MRKAQRTKDSTMPALELLRKEKTQELQRINFFLELMNKPNTLML